MSVSAENVARLICQSCGITRDLGQKKSDYLSKAEMLGVFAFIEHLRRESKAAADAALLVGLDPSLIETLKRLDKIGK